MKKKVAFFDYGFDITYKGIINVLEGWRMLLSDQYDFDYVYMDKAYNADLKALPGVNFLKYGVDTDLEEYDVLFFNCAGTGTHQITKKNPENFEKMLGILFGLKRPITCFIDHGKIPAKYQFMNHKNGPVYAFGLDTTLAYAPKLYVETGNLDPSRVFLFSLFHNWVGEIDDTYAVDRDVDILYMSRCTSCKNPLGFIEGATSLRELKPDARAEMYGYMGGIGEAHIRTHPMVHQKITKSPEKFKKNSPEAFITFHRFNTNSDFVSDRYRHARFSWAAGKAKIRKSDGIDEQVLYAPDVRTLEGSMFMSVRHGTIPILNPHCRDMEVCGKSLEDWGAFLFVEDPKDLGRMIQDADESTLRANLRKFGEAYLDKEKFKDAVGQMIEKMIENGKQPKFRCEYPTFSKLIHARNRQEIERKKEQRCRK